jgi:hypothetical protein
VAPGTDLLPQLHRQNLEKITLVSNRVRDHQEMLILNATSKENAQHMLQAVSLFEICMLPKIFRYRQSHEASGFISSASAFVGL